MLFLSFPGPSPFPTRKPITSSKVVHVHFSKTQDSAEICVHLSYLGEAFSHLDKRSRFPSENLGLAMLLGKGIKVWLVFGGKRSRLGC